MPLTIVEMEEAVVPDGAFEPLEPYDIPDELEVFW